MRAVVKFDCIEDVEWAKRVNKKMTAEGFGLIHFEPGLTVYEGKHANVKQSNQP